MASNLEFVPYKEFVEGLSEATEFASTDKSTVSNSTDGPRKTDAPASYKFALKSVIEKYDEVAGLGNNQFTPYRSVGKLSPGVTYYLYVNQFKHTSATSGYLFAFVKNGTPIITVNVYGGGEIEEYYTFTAEENAEYSWGGRCDADDTMKIELLTGKKHDVGYLESCNLNSLITKKDQQAGAGNNTFSGYREIGELSPGVTYYVYVNNYKHLSATSGFLFVVRNGTSTVASEASGNDLKPYYTFTAEKGAVYSWGGRCDADDVMQVEFLPYKKENGLFNDCMPAVVYALKKSAVANRDGCLFYVTDCHANLSSLSFAAELRRDQFASLPVLSGGDVPQYGPLDDGAADVIAEYIKICQKNKIYIVLGQHEVGFAPTADPTADRGRQKSLCLSHEQAFETFIAPLKGVWGMPTLDTIYYYKDFGNIRLFSLYQYDRPEVDDPGDSSMYKYQRALLWYGQDQIDWFIESLMSMGSGKVAVILLHQPTKDITKDDSVFGYGVAIASNKIADDPITEIIEAYNSRGTLIKTYEPYDSETYLVSDGFSVSVDRDFSSAAGKVAFTLQGDNHADCSGKYKLTDITAVCLASSGRPEFSAVSQNTGMISDYIVNVLGIGISSSEVVITRCGQTFFKGKVRNCDILNF